MKMKYQKDCFEKAMDVILSLKTTIYLLITGLIMKILCMLFNKNLMNNQKTSFDINILQIYHQKSVHI